MRYATGHRDETKARILHAAGRGFRAQGYGGLGIDGLARSAGVTSGAFYGHFRSKIEAFRAALSDGLRELRDAVLTQQRAHGPAAWVRPFVAFYFGPMLECELADGCALPSLTAEVGRADIETRTLFGRELAEIVRVIESGLSDGDGEAADGPPRARALEMLALMAGGVALTRAVSDEAMAVEITQAVARAVTRIGESGRAGESGASGSASDGAP